jgi:hypothetical protein
LGARVSAWKLHHNWAEETGCRYLRESVQLSSLGDTIALKAVIAGIDPSPKVIVFDTLARCAVGLDENQAKDMGKLIAEVDALIRQFGATVILIHHRGKNSENGPRGSTALLAAIDTCIEVTDGGSNTVNVTCNKMKDAPEFPTMRLKLKAVGNSCALTRFDFMTENADEIRPPKVSNNNLTALAVLANHEVGLSYSEWLRLSTLKREAYKTVRGDLVKKGFVKHEGTLYRITDYGLAALSSIKLSKGPANDNVTSEGASQEGGK